MNKIIQLSYMTMTVNDYSGQKLGMESKRNMHEIPSEKVFQIMVPKRKSWGEKKRKRRERGERKV